MGDLNRTTRVESHYQADGTVAVYCSGNWAFTTESVAMLREFGEELIRQASVHDERDTTVRPD